MSNFTELRAKLREAQYSIALLAPVGMGAHGETITSLIKANEQKDRPFRIYPFFSRGYHATNIRICLEEILNDDYDLLITVGLKCTSLAKQGCEEKKNAIPILFIGITDPVEQGLITSIEQSGNNITGIMYPIFNTIAAMEFLYACKPSVKEVLFPYLSYEMPHKIPGSPQFWLDSEINKAIQFLQSKNVTATRHQSQTLEALFLDLKKLTLNLDTIAPLEGNGGVDIHDALSPLCNQNGITLFGSLLNVVQTSAAIGYGAHFGPLGQKAIDYAQKILAEGIHPSNLPCFLVDNIRKPAVNLLLATQQGLDPDHIAKVCHEWNGIIFGTK